MVCPFCGSTISKVIDKRSVGQKGGIRRRRQCLKCKKRYTTYEALAPIKTLIIKRDGRREYYSHEKLRLGILKALEKRPALDKAENMVNKIESRIRIRGLKEISSESLGRWVLSELKKIDGVAYLRFASVYRSFGEPSDFVKEVNNLS